MELCASTTQLNLPQGQRQTRQLVQRLQTPQVITCHEQKMRRKSQLSYHNCQPYHFPITNPEMMLQETTAFCGGISTGLYEAQRASEEHTVQPTLGKQLELG